jgi:HNH endonuclease
MHKCIYCQQERSTGHYTKVEHVLPQSFGRFRQNLTLRNVVCDQCNQYFGDNLEIFLGRDTFEGQLRFAHGVKSPSEFKSAGRQGRIVIKSTEGDFAGSYLQRYFSPEKGEIVVRPLPQVGFMLAPHRRYRYYLLDEIPTKAELDGLGYEETHPRSIVALEVHPDELNQRLKERGIDFRYRGPIVPAARPDTLGVELQGTIDHAIFRSVAKIAFNYLAYWEGSEFVQHRAFDKVRRYIRWQHAPGYKLIQVDEKAILENEPIEGMRRLGHLITVNWAADGVSVLAQVSLFNWMTYLVCLAPDFSGPPPQLTRGHFFNVSDREIFELGSRATDPRE